MTLMSRQKNPTVQQLKKRPPCEAEVVGEAEVEVAVRAVVDVVEVKDETDCKEVLWLKPQPMPFERLNSRRQQVRLRLAKHNNSRVHHVQLNEQQSAPMTNSRNTSGS